jgi:hypothetical protein
MRAQRYTWHRLALVMSAITLTISTPARAAVGFETSDGWKGSFEGFVNAFAVNQIGSRPPDGVAPDALLTTDPNNAFRIRTGLLPGLLAFNVSAPRTEGLDMKARVGFYPQIQNANTRNQFGSQIDLRELYFTVDGSFGQVLAGRALNLYQGKNILTDMTLLSVGAQGPISAGGTTLGRIGFGYVYTNFGAQLRYTTPEFAGAKLAIAAVDPSQIAGSGVAATETRLPGVEAELSYGRDVGPAKVQAWVSGLGQRAWIPATDTAVRAVGVAGGLGAKFSRVDLLASGFGGSGLGSFFLLDTDSLDATGEERESYGFLAQGLVSVLPATRLGLSYGQNTMRETGAEEAARAGGAAALLERRWSITGGVYHDVNKYLKVMGEYTRATTEWFGGQDQAVDVIALGGFFFW